MSYHKDLDEYSDDQLASEQLRRDRLRMEGRCHYCINKRDAPPCKFRDNHGDYKAPPVRPTIVTLCGSTRFADAYIKATRDETLQGKIVISVGLFGHQEGLDMGGETKKMLDELHLRKIDMADEILVINGELCVCLTCEKPVEKTSYCSVCNDWPIGLKRVFYIGDSTRREIEYARNHGKKVRYLNPPE